MEHDVELHGSDSRQDRRLRSATLRDQELHHALGLELRDPAPELLGATGIRRADHGEVLGSERRHARERHRICGVKRVAGTQRPGVDEPHDVAGVGEFHRGAVAAEHGVRVLGGEGPPRGGMDQDHAALEHAGADAHEGDAVAVRGVHVGLHLEHEPGERRLQRARAAIPSDPRRRRRGKVDDGIEQQAYTEVGDRRAKEHRRGLRGQERGGVVLPGHLVQKVQLLDGSGPAGQVCHQLVGDGDPVLGCRLGARQGRG